MSLELAWAAGLFEGEGFIVKRVAGQRTYIEIGIEMTDLDVVEHFVNVMQTNGIIPADRPSGPRKPSRILKRKRQAEHHKDRYSWKTTGNTGIAAYLLMRPYLGERRRAKGDAILEAHNADIARARANGITECRQCGATIHMKEHGRSKVWCSEDCRTKWRSRHEPRRLRFGRRLAQETKLF